MAAAIGSQRASVACAVARLSGCAFAGQQPARPACGQLPTNFLPEIPQVFQRLQKCVAAAASITFVFLVVSECVFKHCRRLWVWRGRVREGREGSCFVCAGAIAPRRPASEAAGPFRTHKYASIHLFFPVKPLFTTAALCKAGTDTKHQIGPRSLHHPAAGSPNEQAPGLLSLRGARGWNEHEQPYCLRGEEGGPPNHFDSM
jgi:hypothetical protein